MMMFVPIQPTYRVVACQVDLSWSPGDDNDDNDHDDDKDGFDRFRLNTRNTIPFGWPIKRGRHILLSMSLRLPLFLPEAAKFLCFRLKTRSTIPFGWLINFGRITLFLLFFPGGVLSALLSEGGKLEALMKLPSVLLSLLSSESA